MNNTSRKFTMKESVLDAIKTNRLHMRSRLHFTLKVMLLIALGVAILAISIFIFNFILFSIRLNSHDALLGFGYRGVLVFLGLFPWALLFIDLALIIGLESLLRKFEFGYKIPILYLIAGICGLTIAAGTVVGATPLNDTLLLQADQHLLPPAVERFYKGARRPPPPLGNVHRGIITAVNGDRLTIKEAGEASTTISILLPVDNPRATRTLLKPGDEVFVAGDRDREMIRAFGLRKLHRDRR